MLKLRILLLSDKLYKILVVIVTLYSLIYINFMKHESVYKDEDNISGKIISIEKKEDKTIYIIKAKEKIIAKIYEKNKYHLGDLVNIKGYIKEIEKPTVFNTFNYKEYLKTKKIYKEFIIKEMKLIKKNKNIFYFLKDKIINMIDNKNEASYIIKAFFIGDKDGFNKDVINSYIRNGISHLLALSGSNVAFFAVILLFIFKKIEEEKRYIIVNIFMIFYLFLTSFTPSISRAVFFFLLLSINKVYYFHIKTINILYLTYTIMVLLNPYIILDVGFQYSVLICFYLIKKEISKNKIKALFEVSSIAFIASLPITIYNFNEINFLSILYNLIFVPIISLFIYPLSILAIFIPFLEIPLFYSMELINNLSLYLDKINIARFIFKKTELSIIYIFLSYLVLLKNKKYIIGLIIILIIHYNLNLKNSVTMIDQTCPIMIQKLNYIFARKPLISSEI